MSLASLSQLANLANYSEFDQKALALVGLSLMDCINTNRLIVSDQLAADEISMMLRKIDFLYEFQDVLHGGADPERTLAALAVISGSEVTQ